MSASLPQQWFDRAREDLQVARLAECEALESTFAAYRADCIIVDQYYIPARYPDGVPGGLAGGLPGEPEAREALKAADEVFRFVAAQLP